MEIWKLLEGTYEQGTQVKIVPANHNDPRYILVGGRDSRMRHLLALFLLDHLNGLDTRAS